MLLCFLRSADREHPSCLRSARAGPARRSAALPLCGQAKTTRLNVSRRAASDVSVVNAGILPHPAKSAERGQVLHHDVINQLHPVIQGVHVMMLRPVAAVFVPPDGRQ